MSALTRLLDKSLLQERQSETASAMGGSVKTWGTVGTNAAVACTVYPAGDGNASRLLKAAGIFLRPDVVVDTIVVTELDIAALIEDRLTIGGKTYMVVGYEPFDNSAFGPPVYVTMCGRRNQ